MTPRHVADPAAAIVGDGPPSPSPPVTGSAALRGAGEREPTPRQRVARIVWPAFLAAACLDMLVFAVLDPGDLRWFGSTPVGWSAPTVHSVTFLIFWAVVSASAALTTLLSLPQGEVDGLDRRAGHRVEAAHPRAAGLREAPMDDQERAARDLFLPPG